MTLRYGQDHYDILCNVNDDDHFDDLCNDEDECYDCKEHDNLLTITTTNTTRISMVMIWTLIMMTMVMTTWTITCMKQDMYIPEARLSLLSQGGSLGASGPNDSRLSCS